MLPVAFPTYSAVLTLALSSMLLAAAYGQAPQPQPLVPNASFEEGAQQPDGWRGGAGTAEWVEGGRSGDRAVRVTGGAEDEAHWRCASVPFEPRATYRISFWSRVEPGASGGCTVSGPDFANRDFDADDQWTRHSFVFVAPDPVEGAYLRLGQWHRNGQTVFDDVSLVPVTPVHRRVGDLVLGDGEEIVGAVYRCQHNLGGEGANYQRCLHQHSAHFNSNRWVMGEGSEVVYLHELPGRAQQSARVEAQVGWYQDGALLLEASTDGERWTQIGELTEEGSATAEVPAEMLPAQAVYVRLRATGALQVTGYTYEAELAEAAEDLTGATRFVEVRQSSPRVEVAIEDVGDLIPGAANKVSLQIANRSEAPLRPPRR